ncbi:MULTISPECIES: DUF998 domain-containing protein [Pseudofrankia]|uniref:DUF998 domain-containing protein n=1 Tax=Pseudofrankia TaxID=2994363 RepID=UPI000234B679|nr:MULTISPECIES: DUF998 domain-containing protein [Pseudofrankia]OHV40565.1 hypothetical protein BCD49_08320 [Pseudofrankia sp. EUN1h]
MTSHAPGIPSIAARPVTSRRFWGAVGLAAQLVFTVGWLLAGTWQGPRYDAVRDSISDETALTAPHAWLPITCQLLAGLGTIAFALFGLRPALTTAGRTARYAPWMLAGGAVAYLVIFPRLPCRLADTACGVHQHLYSAGGLTDAIASGALIALLAVAPFPLWRRMREIPRWRRLRPVMLGARVLGPILLIATASQGPYAPGSQEGLFERMLALTVAVWICALAASLLVSSNHDTAAGSPDSWSGIPPFPTDPGH